MNKHQYKPMLAKTATKPFSSKDWFYEVKWDGFRAISYVGKNLSIRSRNQKELKKNFPELRELQHLAKNIIVDGEIVIITKGKVDFHTLQERGHLSSFADIQKQAAEHPATYIVFDILEKNGRNITNLPLVKRKKILKESLKEGKNIFVADFIAENGKEFYRLALKKNLEGIMAKKKNSIYEEGFRSPDWLKIKKINTSDCVILGYTKGKHSRGKTFGAVILGLYDKNGNPVFVGKVGTGFSEESIRNLMSKFKKLKINTPLLTIKSSEILTWVKPKLVAEIDYQVITNNNRLRMPRFKRLRDDKLPKQCTLDQITNN